MVAFKIVITALFVTVLPVILNNAFYALINAIFASATSQLNGVAGTVNSGHSFVFQLTGMVAWTAVQFNLVSAFSVMISILCVKYILGLIPFVRL